MRRWRDASLRAEAASATEAARVGDVGCDQRGAGEREHGDER
jgi:hypothetical protein